MLWLLLLLLVGAKTGDWAPKNHQDPYERLQSQENVFIYTYMNYSIGPGSGGQKAAKLSAPVLSFVSEPSYCSFTKPTAGY